MKRLQSGFFTLCVLALALSLTSCENPREFAANMRHSLSTLPITSQSSQSLLDNGCPETVIVNELAAVIDFMDSAPRDSSNMIVRTDIVGAKGTCEYNDKTLTMDLALDFRSMLGDSGRMVNDKATTYTYPYFVAVTAPNGKILVKKVFDLYVDFEAGQTTVSLDDMVRQIVPLAYENEGPRHKVMVGFQLSTEQLEYNRKLITMTKK